MSQRQSCEAVGITPRTLQNWRHAPDGDGRLDRSNFTSPRQIPEDLREQIVDRFCKADVRDLSLTQAFYKLLDENKEYWCSLSTLYRLFRARGLNARRAPTREARRRSKPTAYSAEKPNEVWTWDITYLRSSKYTGRFYYAYVIVDVYSRMVVSARVFEADNADFAVRFLGDAFRRYGIKPGQLVVHSDNGASMKAAPTLALLEKNGITFSHSRPRVSNDNPYSESFFRTLKYSGDYLYPRDGFDNAEEAEQWVQGFVDHYNEHHRHRGIRMVTPGQRYRGEDAEVLRRRRETMLEARRRHPERWITGRVLNCTPIKEVWLNPEMDSWRKSMPRQLEQTPRCCCNKAFGGFPRASGSASSCLRRLILPACRPLRANGAAQLHQRFFYGPKTLGESAEGGEGKALTELRLQPTFKNKIGESSLDIHRASAYGYRRRKAEGCWLGSQPRP